MAVFFAGLITFGMTTEPPKETAKESKQEQAKQKKPEKSIEQPKETAKEQTTGEENKTEPIQETANQNFASDQQRKVAELMISGSDFLPLAEAYYHLPKGQKTSTWDNFIFNKEVTWTGTIADLETISDSIVVYGKEEGYNGEDWLTISTEKKDLMPYVFIAELKNEDMKKGLKKGDKVTVKGIIGSRGDKELQYNWKLYDAEVVE